MHTISFMAPDMPGAVSRSSGPARDRPRAAQCPGSRRRVMWGQPKATLDVYGSGTADMQALSYSGIVEVSENVAVLGLRPSYW